MCDCEVTPYKIDCMIKDISGEILAGTATPEELVLQQLLIAKRTRNLVNLRSVRDISRGWHPRY